MPESPRDQILKLRQEIQRHEELYRKKHAPEISDFEFDKLVDQLADLEREFPMFAGPDLGIGDDCALLSPRPGHQLALSTDMLVEGRHFLSTVDPVRLGHKSLAVNLSDLAACGAQPRAFLLSLSMPRADAAWLDGFSQGLFALADAHGCELIGGDTTQGPLNISITVVGDVPQGQALLRSGAREGDDIYVSGNVGDARLALEVFRGSCQVAGDVLERVRITEDSGGGAQGSASMVKLTMSVMKIRKLGPQ